MKRVDDVEAAYDITSNVFVKALTNIHKYEFRGVPFSSWLFRIAKSELYQSFRDKKARRTVSIDKVIVADLFEEFEESFNEERKEKLMEALRLINEKDLALIELRYFEEDPTEKW